MSFYRVKQFIWAIKAIAQKIDDTYINKYLDNDEKILFNKLKKSDKQHCIRVCKEALNMLDTTQTYKDLQVNKVAKAALLHDIGKSEYSLNVVEKSVLVILNKLTNGNLKKFDSIKIVDSYYNHPKKGAKILKEFKVYDKDFLETVRYHHSTKKFENNKLLNIIRQSDNKS